MTCTVHVGVVVELVSNTTCTVALFMGPGNLLTGNGNYERTMNSHCWVYVVPAV